MTRPDPTGDPAPWCHAVQRVWLLRHAMQLCADAVMGRQLDFDAFIDLAVRVRLRKQAYDRKQRARP